MFLCKLILYLFHIILFRKLSFLYWIYLITKFGFLWCGSKFFHSMQTEVRNGKKEHDVINSYKISGIAEEEKTEIWIIISALIFAAHEDQPGPGGRHPHQQHGSGPPEGPEGAEWSLHLHGLQHRGGHRQQHPDIDCQVWVIISVLK